MVSTGTLMMEISDCDIIFGFTPGKITEIVHQTDTFCRRDRMLTFITYITLNVDD